MFERFTYNLEGFAIVRASLVNLWHVFCVMRDSVSSPTKSCYLLPSVVMSVTDQVSALNRVYNHFEDRERRGMKKKLSDVTRELKEA